MSMIAVPPMVGVMILRSRPRLAARGNCISDEATISVHIIAMPPSRIAVTQTEMKAPDVPMKRT